MFGKDFYPTKPETIEIMMSGYDVTGKVCYDPEGGKGNIVDWLKAAGAKDVIASEINDDLRKILKTKCRLIAKDFLTVKSSDISHVDFIVMNPPFSADETHILHAWEIAPPGCQIISLCNESTVKNYRNTAKREQLFRIIEESGSHTELGDCFSTAERKTEVRVSLIKLHKAGNNYEQEFEGFFMEDDPVEAQENGIMSYNVVRDLVNRYVAAMKLFDKQLSLGVEMDSLIGNFYSIDGTMSFQCTTGGAPVLRQDFKKALQKSGWSFIFDKMNMKQYATTGLKSDINKFVEQQQTIPFTMKNIYRMIEIVIGTQAQRMDKSLVEVFDKLTKHHEDNRYNVPGWKTNSHYLVGKMFILDWMTERRYNGGMDIRYSSGGGNSELIEDLQKALCYITGMSYGDCTELRTFARDLKCDYGQWYSWGFFEIKGFKKGTMHFRFQNEELWGKFNQHIARIKGYPLFEHKVQTAYQQRNAGVKSEPKTKTKAGAFNFNFA